MNFGGIIAGAMGGGAQAAGQMADSNLRAQAEEERFARERSARMQDAQTQRTWRKEDAVVEMDQRLARIAGEVRAKTQAGIESQGILNSEREKIRGGLIGAEIDKAIPPHIAEQSKNWSPEAQAQLAADKEAVRSRAASDPSVGREVGLAMGEVNQKDVMLNDVAQERARNQQLQMQMRDDQVNRGIESREKIASERLEALVSGGGGGKAAVTEKLNTTIGQQRLFLTSTEETYNRLKLMGSGGKELQELEQDRQNARELIRAATGRLKESLSGEQGGSASRTESAPPKSTDKPEVRDERIRIIRNEYDSAVKAGNQEVATATARELKKQFGVDVNVPESQSQANPAAQNITPAALAATAKKYGITEAQVLERLDAESAQSQPKPAQKPQAPQKSVQEMINELPQSAEQQRQNFSDAQKRIADEAEKRRAAERLAEQDSEIMGLKDKARKLLRDGRAVQANELIEKAKRIASEKYGA